jgi:hypothetical protein
MASDSYKPEMDEGKFTELLLYVASRLAGDPSYGSIKLNKALFFSDFFHYADYGSSITGAEYVKHPLGPAPRGILAIQHRLIENHEAALATVLRGGRQQKMLFALREADLSEFTGTEIAQVESVLSAMSGTTAHEVSEISHAMLGWQVAGERETIPYHSIFLYSGPVTDEDVKTAQSVVEQLRPELERAGVLEARAA